MVFNWTVRQISSEIGVVFRPKIQTFRDCACPIFLNENYADHPMSLSCVVPVTSVFLTSECLQRQSRRSTMTSLMPD